MKSIEHETKRVSNSRPFISIHFQTPKDGHQIKQSLFFWSINNILSIVYINNQIKQEKRQSHELEMYISITCIPIIQLS